MGPMKNLRSTLKLFTALLLTGLCYQASATRLLIQHAFNYHSHSDDVENFSYNRMNNYLFIGASINKSERFFLGQSVHIWNKTHQAGSDGEASTISLTELGPRVVFLIGPLFRWHVSVAYHIYTKGTRSIEGSSEKISGSAMMGSLGYQIRLSKVFYMGASLHYHSMSITESVEDSEQTDVTNSYTTIIPAIEFSLRF